MERERELRAQLADSEVSNIISKLREENDGLRADNDYLREQVAILTQDARLHAAVKAEVQNLQQHVRAASLDHSHAIATLTKEKEQLAGEATEALGALRSELEMRTQVHEQEAALSAERAQELAGRVAELEENLAEARDLMTTAEEAAKAYSQHNLLLENDNAKSGRRIAEQEADINGLQARIAVLLQDLQHSETGGREGKERNALLAADVTQKEELIKSLEESVRAAEESGRHEREMLSMQVQDQKRKIAALASEVQRAEDDAKTVREEMRLELRKAEAENITLRDNLRLDREKMEELRQEHRSTIDDLHRQLRGKESALAKRQEEVQRHMKALERELQVASLLVAKCHSHQLQWLRVSDRKFGPLTRVFFFNNYTHACFFFSTTTLTRIVLANKEDSTSIAC